MNIRKITCLILISAVLLTGCSKVSDTSFSSEVTQSTTSETSETSETIPELYEYNPHPYSTIVAPEIPQDHWDSLYNLVDAIREGKDSFDCSSAEAYEWCTNLRTLSNLVPAAGAKITGESNDGTTPFENGKGRIYYNMPVEEFVAREKAFEKAVEDVLNSVLEKDDNEFEKCLKLYDYMESNYVYETEGRGDSGPDDSYVYYALTNHTGQCIDLAGLYAFLLLEADVQAASIACFDSTDHQWVYVLVNGKGYHIDPTWSLKDSRETEYLYLDYFMMTDEIRTNTGCNVVDLAVALLPQFWLKESSVTMPADDGSLYAGDYSVFVSLDEENKTLTYLDLISDEEKTLKYS